MATLFYNGRIYSMDESDPTPTVVLVNDRGQIQWTGDMDSLPTIGRLDKLKRVNLDGRTMIPGFNDAHVHVWKLGMLLTAEVDARRANAPDIPSIISLFRAQSERMPSGAWLTGRGYNEADLPEGRHPSRYDLDDASEAHPIALTRTCGHMIVANSLALRLAGISAETPDPPGGVIVRDGQGEPTGLLQETAMGLIASVIAPPDDETLGSAIREANYHQLRLGITSATDPMLLPSHLRVYLQLEADGDLAVRINGMPIRRPDGGTETLPLPEVHISNTLRIDTVKFFADGGLSGATAAISQPYKVTGNYGVLRFETEELFELMWEAHTAGFRIGTHAIGDLALDQVISVYEELYRRAPGQRHRIEHLGLPSAEHLQRCADMGVIAVPQTVFLPALGSSFRRYLPDDYFPRCYPVRSMLEAGLTVALSSDAPVVPDDNPLLGIKAAIDRKDGSGSPIAPEQSITAYDALYAYTMGGAIASGDDQNRGSITPGKWADMVILSGDPLNTPPDDLLHIRVEQTYVGGQLVYEG